MEFERERRYWNWDRCKTKIRGLTGRLGFTKASTLRFRGLRVSLEDGKVHDDLKHRPFPEVTPRLYCILSGYAEAQPVLEVEKLVSFRQLHGEYAYYNAFFRREVRAIPRIFGSKPRMLVKAAK